MHLRYFIPGIFWVWLKYSFRQRKEILKRILKYKTVEKDIIHYQWISKYFKRNYFLFSSSSLIRLISWQSIEYYRMEWNKYVILQNGMKVPVFWLPTLAVHVNYVTRTFMSSGVDMYYPNIRSWYANPATFISPTVWVFPFELL